MIIQNLEFHSSRWLTDCCVVVAKTGEHTSCQGEVFVVRVVVVEEYGEGVE